jgi:hypothetical protein
MQRIKFLLMFGLLLAFHVSDTSFAASGVREAVSSDPAAENVQPAPIKKNQHLGYAWPFADRDVKADLANGPVVLELFTTQGCIFCPVADKFFADLVANAPGVIGLACHVTYLSAREGNISYAGCTERQFDYAKTIAGGSVFTPQIVINGRKETFGYEYEKVYALLKDGLKNRPAPVAIAKGEGALYSFGLPEVKLAEGETAEFQIFQVRGPVNRKITDGPNESVDVEYHHSASSITTLEATGKAQTLEVEVIPEDNIERIVAMVRVAGKIMAVGQIKL